MSLADIIGKIMTGAFGLAFVSALLVFVYKRHAMDWDQLVRVYGRPWQTPLAERRFQNLVLYSEGRFAKSYASLLTIGLYDQGLGLRLSPIFAPFHAPIFIPYTDIQGWKQIWYVNADSVELAFSKLPDMRLIMPADQVDWIKAGTTHAPIEISDTRPAHGHWPSVSYAAAIASGVMAIGLIVFLAFSGTR